jgi:hypothetical protein
MICLFLKRPRKHTCHCMAFCAGACTNLTIFVNSWAFIKEVASS